MTLAEELRQVRDKYTMACPDKPHTPFAVISRAAERIETLEARIRAATGILLTGSGLNVAVYPSEILRALEEVQEPIVSGAEKPITAPRRTSEYGSAMIGAGLAEVQSTEPGGDHG